jgi:acetyl/propionyl-CoA carboxylase alpha subunit
LEQAAIQRRGHALECRLYAEDPATGFLPDTGPVLKFAEPRGPGVRVDAGVATGDKLSHHYDPLIAKIIVQAESREAAIRRMQAALRETAVLGLKTNLEFLQDVLAHPAFQRGEAATDFVDRHFANWRPPASEAGRDAALIAAALSELAPPAPAIAPRLAATATEDHRPWSRTDGFRLGAGR